jgi:hypothetical protein
VGNIDLKALLLCFVTIYHVDASGKEDLSRGLRSIRNLLNKGHLEN